MRKCIKINQIPGLTIEKIDYLQDGEQLIITFTDNSYVLFGVTHYGDSYEIEILPSLPNRVFEPYEFTKMDFLRLELGTEEEYDANVAWRNEQIQKNEESRERRRYLELKKKFEHWDGGE